MAEKKYTREDLGNLMRAEVVTLATKLGMDQDQAFKGEFEDTVEWILENQDGGEDKSTTKKDPPVKRKTRSRTVKKATKVVKASAKDDEDATKIDLGPIEEKLAEIKDLFSEQNADISKAVEDLAEQMQELRADVWITQQLVIAHFKLFENPKGVDKMIKKLEEEVGVAEDPE